jgi:hypothetical protein
MAVSVRCGNKFGYKRDVSASQYIAENITAFITVDASRLSRMNFSGQLPVTRKNE